MVHEDRDAGSVVGYVSWARQGFVGRDYITFLCVDGANRRRGLATALSRAAVAVIGPGRSFISTEEDNHPMLALLRREGWNFARSVSGANLSGAAELFFFKDAER